MTVPASRRRFYFHTKRCFVLMMEVSLRYFHHIDDRYETPGENEYNRGLKYPSYLQRRPNRAILRTFCLMQAYSDHIFISAMEGHTDRLVMLHYGVKYCPYSTPFLKYHRFCSISKHSHMTVHCTHI